MNRDSFEARRVQRSTTYAQVMTLFHQLNHRLVEAHKHLHRNPRKCKLEMQKMDAEFKQCLEHLKQLAAFDGALTKDETTGRWVAS